MIDIKLQVEIVADLQVTLLYNKIRATASKDQAEVVKHIAQALYYAQATLQSMKVMYDD